MNDGIRLLHRLTEVVLADIGGDEGRARRQMRRSAAGDRDDLFDSAIGAQRAHHRGADVTCRAGDDDPHARSPSDRRTVWCSYPDEGRPPIIVKMRSFLTRRERGSS